MRLRVRNHRVFDQGARGARFLTAGPPPVAIGLKGPVNLT